MLPQLPTSLAAPLRPRTNNAARACSQTTSAVERNRTSAAPTNLISSLISGRPVAKPTSPPGRRGRAGRYGLPAAAEGCPTAGPRSAGPYRRFVSSVDGADERGRYLRRGADAERASVRYRRRPAWRPARAIGTVIARAWGAFVGTPAARRDNGTKKANVRRTCR